MAVPRGNSRTPRPSITENRGSSLFPQRAPVGSQVATVSEVPTDRARQRHHHFAVANRSAHWYVAYTILRTVSTKVALAVDRGLGQVSPGGVRMGYLSSPFTTERGPGFCQALFLPIRRASASRSSFRRRSGRALLASSPLTAALLVANGKVFDLGCDPNGRRP